MNLLAWIYEFPLMLIQPKFEIMKAVSVLAQNIVVLADFGDMCLMFSGLMFLSRANIEVKSLSFPYFPIIAPLKTGISKEGFGW